MENKNGGEDVQFCSTEVVEVIASGQEHHVALLF